MGRWHEGISERSLGLDFVECHRDSAKFEQVRFALAALAILQLSVLAAIAL